jgi:hypothetical protein
MRSARLHMTLAFNTPHVCLHHFGAFRVALSSFLCDTLSHAPSNRRNEMTGKCSSVLRLTTLHMPYIRYSTRSIHIHIPVFNSAALFTSTSLVLFPGPLSIQSSTKQSSNYTTPTTSAHTSTTRCQSNRAQRSGRSNCPGSTIRAEPGC